MEDISKYYSPVVSFLKAKLLNPSLILGIYFPNRNVNLKVHHGRYSSVQFHQVYRCVVVSSCYEPVEAQNQDHCAKILNCQGVQNGHAKPEKVIALLKASQHFSTEFCSRMCTCRSHKPLTQNRAIMAERFCVAFAMSLRCREYFRLSSIAALA